MKSGKLTELLKKGNFVIPYYLFQLRDKLSVTLEEFVLLSYLMNQGNKIVFNLDKIITDLAFKLEDVMTMIDSLSEKKYLSVDVIKNDKGIMEEYIVLDLFFDKVTMLLMEEINQNNEVTKVNVFEKIEEEFARPLTSIEYEIIKSWLENGTSEDLVLEALKEAVFNGVTNLRYMDKILYEWTKKGIKNKIKDDNRKDIHEEDILDFEWFDENE